MVVGLGNPGERYRHTPHNMGFEVIDELCARLGLRLRTSRRLEAQYGAARAAGAEIALLKPLTFMNNSGAAVAAVAAEKGLGAEDIIVALDDADLPAGRLRVRKRGSAAGHKGLQSVIDRLGTDAFARVRIGIGRGAGRDLVRHVLSAGSGASRDEMKAAVERAADAVLCIIEQGADAAMNRFNGPAAAGETNEK